METQQVDEMEIMQKIDNLPDLISYYIDKCAVEEIYFYSEKELTEEEWRNPLFEFEAKLSYIGKLFGNHLQPNSKVIFNQLDRINKSIIEGEHLSTNEKFDIINIAIDLCREQYEYFNTYNEFRFLNGIKTLLVAPSTRKREVIFHLVKKSETWQNNFLQAIGIRKDFYYEVIYQLEKTHRILLKKYSANTQVKLNVRSPQLFLYELYLGLVETPDLLHFQSGSKSSFMTEFYALFGEVSENSAKTRLDFLKKEYPSKNLEKLSDTVNKLSQEYKKSKK